jgi:xanthine dehydrogenase accessory factor
VSAARRILVRGAGDIGSAVAVRLFQAGHAVVIHEDPQPTTTRRGMAFADAVFDGEATLDGVKAVRVSDGLRESLASRSVIPVAIGNVMKLLAELQPDVLVDARVRKRSVPEIQRGLAPLTIGLGPNFVAGTTTDIVVETSWEDLGRVIRAGAPLPFRGEPREIAGHARDRYVYAAQAGVFRTNHRVGNRVRAGEPVAHIGAIALTAPLEGVLRGLTRDGVPVSTGTKVIEVDPRGDADLVHGIGERPARIATAIVDAVATWLSPKPNSGSH